MSFWSDFTAELDKVFVAAKTEIAAGFKFITPMVEAGAEEVASAALTAVLQQAPLVIAGSEKLSAATASVVSTLASQGKAVAINIAETAVQGVVNKLATSTAPVAS